MENWYFVKYSALYHVFHTTFHCISRKVDYLWDSVLLVKVWSEIYYRRWSNWNYFKKTFLRQNIICSRKLKEMWWLIDGTPDYWGIVITPGPKRETSHFGHMFLLSWLQIITKCTSASVVQNGTDLCFFFKRNKLSGFVKTADENVLTFYLNIFTKSTPHSKMFKHIVRRKLRCVKITWPS